MRAPPRLAVLLAVLLAACGLLACGGAEVAADEPRARTEPATDPAPPAATDAPVADAPPADAPAPTDRALADLVAALEAPEETPSAAAPRHVVDLLAGCAARQDDDEDCAMASGAAYDPDARRWLVLDVDRGERGPERAWLGLVAPDAEQALHDGDLSPRRMSAVRRALSATQRTLPVAADLVHERAFVEFSIQAYSPLVGLGGPLDGWLLYLETVGDLDHPLHVLRLIRRESLATVELARRPAPRTSSDGDGYFCEARHEAECTEDELRAEGRLAVQPYGVDRVYLADDGATLAITGTRQVAGHGGYPAFHWVVALPDALRATLARP